MDKSIIIIGAGIAGLSSGVYGQMNGYKTHIFELHHLPGGLCTAWKRKGYTFDGCIHWLVGSDQGKGLGQLWNELGALKDTEVINPEIFQSIEDQDGKVFHLYCDVDQLEAHMLELAPQDEAHIRILTKAIRQFTDLDVPVDGFSVGAMLKMLPMLPKLTAMRKWSKVTVKEYADGFQDPFLRSVFNRLFDLPEFPMSAMIMTMSTKNARNAGYPIGGSLPFSKNIEKRYLDLGGEIHYQSRVREILVENNRAVGIRLEDGSEHRADIIISAADGHATIFDMLGGKYVNEDIRRMYREWPIFEGLVQVSLGVDMDLSDAVSICSFPLETPLNVAGEERTVMAYHHFCDDPTMAPNGKSVVVVSFDSNHAYWQELAEDRERYDAEKQQIAIDVMNVLETRFPGFTKAVEAVDIATPLTTERYTGNWQGSIEGWMISEETMAYMFGKSMDKTLPGLENFYMAGQWVEPGGGLPPAAWSGRKLIQKLCADDRKKFTTTLS